VQCSLIGVVPCWLAGWLTGFLAVCWVAGLCNAHLSESSLNCWLAALLAGFLAVCWVVGLCNAHFSASSLAGSLN